MIYHFFFFLLLSIFRYHIFALLLLLLLSWLLFLLTILPDPTVLLEPTMTAQLSGSISTISLLGVIVHCESL